MPYNDDELCVYVGNLHPKVTEDLLFELFLQVGPLKKVCIPKYNGENRNFGFVTFKHEVSVPYAISMLQGVPLFGQHLNLKKRHSRKDTTENREITSDSQMETGDRNNESSFNAGQNLSKGPLTEVTMENLKKCVTMEMKTSTPLSLQNFHGQQDFRGQQDMRNNSFVRSMTSTPRQNLSYQSPLVVVTPPSQMMHRNSSSYMFQNGSRSFGNYHSPVIVRSQRVTPQRSQIYHQNSPTVPAIQLQNQPRMLVHNSPIMPIHSTTTPAFFRHGLQRQDLGQRSMGNSKQNVGMQSFYTRPHPYQG